MNLCYGFLNLMSLRCTQSEVISKHGYFRGIGILKGHLALKRVNKGCVAIYFL